MDRIKVDDLKLRRGVTAARLERRANLRETIAEGMPDSRRRSPSTTSTSTTARRSAWSLSGRARDAFDLSKEKPETRERYGQNTFGQCCLLARRLVEAGTRFVEVNWPKVANSRQPLLGRPRRPVRRG